MKLFTNKKKVEVNIEFLTKTEAESNLVVNRLGDKFSMCTYIDNTYVSIEGVKSDDDWRELGFKLVGHLNANNVTPARMDVPYQCGGFVEGLLLGDYTFQKYKSKPKENVLVELSLDCDDADEEGIQEVIDRATSKANAQCMCRDMVNGTPEDMTSHSILEIVRDSFQDTTVDVSCINQTMLEELGMNGHLAVNRASRHEALTIKLTYNPPTKSNRHIVLVGKGLTYDSGGLSIKPGTSMLTMKCDKGGAMTVFGIMKGLAEVGGDQKVTAYLAMAENMIDGTAYKPDDVLVMKNGKTVHVKNTDAEGRIVLFDNLCLAEEENPHMDEIYTFATLTGAAVMQFGNEACGMVSFNEKMKKKIKSVGEKQGEIFCNAEMHKYTMKGVDDKLADISNMGTPTQGCQKAGLFLTHALTTKMQKKFVHIDIAGPAYSKTGFGSNQAGGTGFAVRTFIEYLGG